MLDARLAAEAGDVVAPAAGRGAALVAAAAASRRRRGAPARPPVRPRRRREGLARRPRAGHHARALGADRRRRRHRRPRRARATRGPSASPIPVSRTATCSARATWPRRDVPRVFGLATSGTSVHRWDTRAATPTTSSTRAPGDPPRRTSSRRPSWRDARALAEAFAKAAVIAGADARVRAPRPPRRPRAPPPHRARRAPRDPGDGAMAGMTFRGLDPRTALARWGLAAVAIGIVAGRDGPGGRSRASRPSWRQPGEPAVAVRAAVRVPRLPRDHRLRGLRAAAVDEAARRSRPPADSFLAPQGPGRDRPRAGRRSTGCSWGSTTRSRSRSPRSSCPGLAPHAPLAVAFGQVALYLAAHRHRQLLRPPAHRPAGVADASTT